MHCPLAADLAFPALLLLLSVAAAHFLPASASLYLLEWQRHVLRAALAKNFDVSGKCCRLHRSL
jgi:hypothetical protein